MASEHGDYWSHIWLRCLLLSLFLCRNVVLPDNNKNFHTSSLCLVENDQALYKKVDGAVIISDNEPHMKCIITFHTDTVLQTFMLRFEHLALDCEDHLYIYDGAHGYGNYEKDLSCRSILNDPDVRTIFTKTNHVTLKYITGKYSPPGNGFKLVITAIKKTGAGCKNFRCKNSYCISQNLTCDGVNHCGDNSDETSQALCYDETATKQILGLNFGTFVSLVLGIFLICCVCVVGVIICVFRKEAQQRQLENNVQLGTPHSMVVGQSPYPTEPTFSSPHGQVEKKPPPYPGNMFLHQMQDGGHREGAYSHAK